MITTSVKKRFFVLLISFCALFVTSWLELFLQRKQHLIGAGLNRASLFLLINVHVVVIVILLYIIIRQSIKLFIERHKEVPGSVFKRNLLFAFTLFSILPSFFVFFIAGKLITTSIDDWFHARIETGLQHGLRLHEQNSAAIRNKLSQAGQELLAQLASVQDNEANSSTIEKIMPTIIATHESLAPLQWYLWKKEEPPLNTSLLDEIKIWREYRTLNDRSMGSLRLKFLKTIEQIDKDPYIFDFYGSLYWVHTYNNQTLILVHRYPENIRYPLIEVQNALADYQQLKSMRNPIYTNYIFTFILVTLLILFLSMWCAFYLARGISTPIQELLKATERVRKGDWDVQVSYHPNSDLRSLARGFNEMTSALKSARSQLEMRHKETMMILENLRSSVFLVNDFGRIITYNNASKELLTSLLGISRFRNKKITFLPAELRKKLFSFVKELHRKNKRQITREFTYAVNGNIRTFMIQLTVLNSIKNLTTNPKSTLVVVEDLTKIVKENQMKTWQEAAKQMAHEIKNPLTPIQLATQRLQRKYRNELADDTIFMGCTNTILNQVKIIQDLASHFSEFASMPLPVIEPIHIHEIINEILCLYRISYPAITFDAYFSSTIFSLHSDKKKIKRVLVNLLDNSVRALHLKETTNPSITITTLVHSDTKKLELLFQDNGPGIPNSVRENLFLPYVSTDKKNMGLGLAIVRDIVTQLGGSIDLLPSKNGALFRIFLSLKD